MTGPHRDQVVIEPTERRAAVLRVVEAARQELLVSVLRCDDEQVLAALARARGRGVQVRVLLSRRAKRADKHFRPFRDFLQRVGGEVHVYGDPVVKYHAKYLVADEGPALVASLNFTTKCFTRTCDFVLITHDHAVVDSLRRLFNADCAAPGSARPDELSDRLILGPERARGRITALLEKARRTICLIDPKMSDPNILALLDRRRAAGVGVEVLTGKSIGDLMAHGKLLLLDGSAAAIGSLSLAPMALEFRRELAVLITEPACVAELQRFVQGVVALAVPGRGNPSPSGDERQ